MDKKLVGLMVIFVMFFGLFTTTVIFNNNPIIKTFTRAATETMPSPDKSLIFSWPKTIKADGKETATIDVLVRNSGTLPIVDKQVMLSTTLGKIDNNNQKTNKLGRATFTITSDVQGTSEISATVDGSTQLINKVSIKFE
ncbi:MAG: Ig-like domain-containing protein [Candidatus Roizmanbacteria bacterium]